MTTALVALLVAQVSATGSVAATGTKPSPRPPARPTPTTFEKVRARAHPVGARVEFAAVVLPRTVIQAQTGGTTKYYGLAVAPDGEYFASVERAIEELRTAVPAALKEAEAAIGDDAGYRRHLEVADQVLKKASGLAPPIAQTIAVELQRFTGAGYKWETVISEGPLVAPLTLPSFAPPPSLNSTFSVDATISRIKELAAAVPPNLEHKLPDYRGPTFFTKREELQAHNEMVRAYNAELERRRRYLLQLTAEDALVASAEMERLLEARQHALIAAVTASQALPSKTFARIHGTAPSAWVRESAPKGKAVVDRIFTSASVLLTTYPSGGTLTVPGQAPVAGPHLLKDVPVGTSLAVGAERSGYRPGSTTAAVQASPGGVMRVEVALAPTPETLAAAAKPASAPARAPGAAWSSRGERGTYIVSQEAPVEWSSPGGKTGRPELILRCAAGVREAYLFYEHGFASAEGDLFARFDGETKPKKFWGAPSQNGQSLFFTGFWTKGTDGFIRELLKHRTMHLSVKPKKKEPLPELPFDLQGLEGAMSAWLEACPLKK